MPSEIAIVSPGTATVSAARNSAAVDTATAATELDCWTGIMVIDFDRVGVGLWRGEIPGTPLDPTVKLATTLFAEAPFHRTLSVCSPAVVEIRHL